MAASAELTMKLSVRKMLARTGCADAPAAATRASSDANDEWSDCPHNLSSNHVLKIKEIKMNTVIPKVMLPALLALAAWTAALTPVRSHAEDSSTRSVRVSIAHLNPNSPEDARKIYRRLHAAAFEACGESTEDIDYIARGGPSDCVKQALANSVLELRSDEVAKLFIKKLGITAAIHYSVTPEILTASK
jgi:UrcA family protein